MAIRLKKEVWVRIRSEYVAGATAEELAARYKGVKAASIHARAGREKWRDIALPPSQQSSRYAASRAKAEGISIDEAVEREAIDQNCAVASHRAGAAIIGALLTDGLKLASEASKQNNAEMAKSASVLISSVKDASTALHLKMEVDRIAFDLEPCTHIPKCADFENILGEAAEPVLGIV